MVAQILPSVAVCVFCRAQKRWLKTPLRFCLAANAPQHPCEEKGLKVPQSPGEKRVNEKVAEMCICLLSLKQVLTLPFPFVKYNYI